MSTFSGLEVAKRALFTQQAALHTTGHNIANANTEGYSRQRVNFEATEAFPSASRNRPQIPGQIGTGVRAGSVQRVRDSFLDTQYRGENSQVGYWETKADALARMENVMNELTNTGLSASMDQFWQSLQDLSVYPENSGARSVVLQRGAALADTFNYFSDSLSNIRGDLKQQINTTVNDANSLMKQIDEINEQITQLETHNYVTNDLYDERDRLIDDLSSILNIRVTKESSSPNTTGAQEGAVSIELLDADGSSTGIQLVDGGNLFYQEISVGYRGDTDSFAPETELDAVTSIHIGEQELEELDGNGALKGLIESYNNTYPEMLGKLDQMAYAFATEFNNIHGQGYTLDGNEGQAFFGGFGDSSFGAAGSLAVAITDPEAIAVSESGETGEGQNALNLAEVFDTPLDRLEGVSIKSFYESTIGELGVQAEQANRMTENTTILRSQVERQRMSVSAVSLDEEMTNMIQFQHAYNAAARNITAIDEMLDRVINNMGLVGR